jgi:hypothetical protein
MASPGNVDLLANRYGHLPYRRRVINLSSGSTATREIVPEESGALFVVPTVSTQLLSLPRISSLALGLTYEFLISTQDALNDINIVSTNDSSALIVGVLTSGATGVTGQSIAPDTTLAQHWCRLTAFSSINWLLETQSQMESSGTGGAVGVLVYGSWTTGTTA